MAPGCILAVVEDAENLKEQCVPQQRVRLYCWTGRGSKAAKLERKWKKMKQNANRIDSSGKQQNPLPTCQCPQTI